MNILHIAHRIPYPPDKGDKIRSYHQVRHLSNRHDVWCACFVDDPSDLKYVEALRVFCRRVAAIPLSPRQAALRGALRLVTGGSLTEGYCANARMRHALRAWSAEVTFDAVLVFSSGMAPYADALNARRKVLDFCDLDSQKWRWYAEQSTGLRRWAYGVEARRLRVREHHWLSTFDACTVVTDAEAEAVTDPKARARLRVVGNGVDAGDDADGTATDESHRVGFVGQMDYRPNVDAVCWFADRVWPDIRRRVPDATFDIVGRSPAREVQALSARDGIRVVGRVDDVRGSLQDIAVSVAPLRMGRGVQNKVLEAMAASRPVVLTSHAAAGIDAVDGRHFIVADDPRKMTHDLVALLKSPQRRSAMGEAAHSHVRDHFRWDCEMDKLEALLIGE